ncbi:hypothetical protein [Chitinophaga sp. LS1]|nr:hypothetical protein [Chitinophaga sp. LS1]WPV70225.1 hypothetical protein QQL36_16080 [Chitinophaga sp. LS1]
MDKKNEQPENPLENKNEQAIDDQNVPVSAPVSLWSAFNVRL